jgi:hypothetical protein
LSQTSTVFRATIPSKPEISDAISG